MRGRGELSGKHVSTRERYSSPTDHLRTKGRPDNAAAAAVAIFRPEEL